MPVLDITESMDDLPGRARSGPNVLAVMLAPSDLALRNQLGNLFQAFIDLHDGSEDVRFAVFSELSTQHWYDEKTWEAGVIAGSLLSLVRRIRKHRTDTEPSLNRAVHILCSTGLLGQPVGRSKVTEAWAEYKGVSHIWAAVHPATLGLHPDQRESITAVMGHAILRIIGWCPAVISVAENWRLFGEGLKNRQGKTLLDPVDTWVAPKGYELGEFFPVVPPLNDGELAALAAYKAPRHSHLKT